MSPIPETLLPCPFCGSEDVDPEGWSSIKNKGPACNKCSGSAESVKEWNTRPLEQSAFAQGERAGIEQAAKIADSYRSLSVGHPHIDMLNSQSDRLALAIRALSKETP